MWDDRDPTRIIGFERLEQWGDLKEKEDRRFYLRRLVKTDSGSRIRPAGFEPGGYGYDTSDLFIVNRDLLDEQTKLHKEVVHQLKDLPANIKSQTPEWQVLQQYVIRLSREYKIHLQPREECIPEAIVRLVEILLIDRFSQENIAAFKCKVVFLNESVRAVIVIYLNLLEKRSQARAMCKQMLAKIRVGFSDLEYTSLGRLPIYNYPVTDLISFIQVGTDSKFELKRILGPKRFDQLFPAKFHQALLMDEKLGYYL